MKNAMEKMCYPVSLRTLHVSGKDATDLEIQRCCTKRYMSQTDIDKLRKDMNEEDELTGIFCDEEYYFTQFLPVDSTGAGDESSSVPGIYITTPDGGYTKDLGVLDEQCYCQTVKHAYVAEKQRQGMSNMGMIQPDVPVWRNTMWVCYLAAISLLLFILFVRFYIY